MSDIAQQFLSNLQAAIQSGDPDKLMALIADDIVMTTPPHAGELRGRDAIFPLLGAIPVVFKNWVHKRVWVMGKDIAMESTATVKDIDLLCMDLITLNDQGQMHKLDVLVRPKAAIEAIVDEVNKLIGKYPDGSK